MFGFSCLLLKKKKLKITSYNYPAFSNLFITKQLQKKKRKLFLSYFISLYQKQKKMLSDFKKKLKNSASSIRSVKSERNQHFINNSTPALSPRISNTHSYRSYSSNSSSTASLPNMPPTPPSHHPSNLSLPFSQSDIFLNHTHLKPGNNAALLAYEKTINLYRENAKHINDPSIQWDLATYLYESSKMQHNTTYIHEAVKILKSLSFKGHAEAQYYLANIYASGQLSKSHKPDFNQAFPLFLQSAKHQHADAAYR